jgi:hypothetical protein
MRARRHKRASDKERGMAEGAGKKRRKTVGGEDGPAMQPVCPQPKPLHKKKLAAPPPDNEGRNLCGASANKCADTNPVDEAAASRPSAPHSVFPSTRSTLLVRAPHQVGGRILCDGRLVAPWESGMPRAHCGQVVALV